MSASSNDPILIINESLQKKRYWWSSGSMMPGRYEHMLNLDVIWFRRNTIEPVSNKIPVMPKSASITLIWYFVFLSSDIV
ncbi:MAG: hypothetical protein O6761_02595 [Thaumarchaeota archaeon]|nr:hypothetical protein [Nitrososphaerota archaeon]